ncbi:uncharacterized protein BP5553_00119 [Venustampulla echinocandica]|uniref:Uncharacterized protein n=1 Tax=Venustampulla echinocandica TaxID=2656787 RepID=A0A370TX91_9HELO|nr:uncharacterized protein BP5553_00119 [Venustampulla echinocandica]RDL40140.1 hypothetical protein BP5553_00119 [Venustampulla echinocandica]
MAVQAMTKRFFFLRDPDGQMPIRPDANYCQLPDDDDDATRSWKSVAATAGGAVVSRRQQGKECNNTAGGPVNSDTCVPRVNSCQLVSPRPAAVTGPARGLYIGHCTSQMPQGLHELTSIPDNRHQCFTPRWPRPTLRSATTRGTI